MSITRQITAKAIVCSIGLFSYAAVAKPKQAAKPKKAEDETSTLHSRLVSIKRAYRQGEITRAAAWVQLTDLSEKYSSLGTVDRVSLLETQAALLGEAHYPILSAIYSAQAIKTAPDIGDNQALPAWSILKKVSETKPIQNLLEIIADMPNVSGHTIPVFGSDWNYFAGNAAARKFEVAKALEFYGNVKVSDRHYLPAKYQQAMLLIESEKADEAEKALKMVLNPSVQKYSTLNEGIRKKLNDYALLALGRLYYERRQFPQSIQSYRSVSRDGLSFYDALFEQSWALFMGGYPAHALGALYGAESPFYQEVFNPEAPLLRAMINYWLCRYDASRNALADFMERYEPQVEKLNDFLSRQRLDAETAYNLFENLISGVSESSLGVPRAVLKTAAEKDSMLLVRDQFAAIIEEKQRLEAKGIFGNKLHIDKPDEYMQRWVSSLHQDIGKHFLAELQDLKKDYENLHSQAEFLYVELLMSEKDQLLGKELHASSKITHVNARQQISGWANKTQSWKDTRNGEYWWDEVGFYIQPVSSMCSVKTKGN